MMSTVSRLSFCLLIVLVCIAFVPVASAQNTSGDFAVAGTHSLVSSSAVVGFFYPLPGKDRDRHHKRESVPEGSSTAAYLLLAGASCLGAIALQSRRKTT